MRSATFGLVSMVLFLGAASSALALTLTPGTILAIDSQSSTIYQFDASGTQLDSMAISLLSTSFVTGITTIDGRVFLFQQGAQGVLEVDLGTGIASNVFNPAVGRDDLGRIGSNLILSFSNQPHNVDPGVIEIYTTTGAFIQQLNVTTQISGGIDSDGSRIFLADEPADLVRIFDLNGVELSTFPIILGGFAAPSGLAYDSFSDTILVADFFVDVIQRYSIDGTKLDEFHTSGVRMDGITVVPASAPPVQVPMGTSFGVLALVALLCVAGLTWIPRRAR